MATCAVRYPKPAVLINGGIPIIFAVIGFAMAVQHRGHWQYWEVAVLVVWGVLAIVGMSRYQTRFTSDAVEQRRFLRQTERHSYSEVEHVGVGRGKSANALTLTFRGGKQMRIYGSESQLIRAREVLHQHLQHLPKRTTADQVL